MSDPVANPLAHVRCAGQHVAFLGVDEAASSAFTLQSLEIFGRMDVCMAMVGMQAELAHEGKSRSVDERDEWPEQRKAHSHRQQGCHCQSLRMAQRHGLRQQLAQHGLYRCNGEQNDNDGSRGAAPRAKHRLQQRRESRLAIGTRNQAAQPENVLSK